MTVLPQATVFTYVQDGPNVLVFLDFHQAVTAQPIPLPNWMIGMVATLVESYGTISLLSSVVSADGIMVSVTGYGSAVIKLSSQN